MNTNIPRVNGNESFSLLESDKSKPIEIKSESTIKRTGLWALESTKNQEPSKNLDSTCVKCFTRFLKKLD